MPKLGPRAPVPLAARLPQLSQGRPPAPAGSLRLDERDHVVTRDATRVSGARDLLGSQVVLAQKAAHSWRHPRVGVAARARAVGRGGRADAIAAGAVRCEREGRPPAATRRRRPSPGQQAHSSARRLEPPRALDQEHATAAGAGSSAGARLFGCRRLGAAAPPSPTASMIAISALLGTVAPSSARILRQGAFERRRDLGVDLVGDDLEERLVLGDVVAGLLEPLADRPLGHALAELGHRHLGHGPSSGSLDGDASPPWFSHSVAHPGPFRPLRLGRTGSGTCHRDRPSARSRARDEAGAFSRCAQPASDGWM